MKMTEDVFTNDELQRLQAFKKHVIYTNEITTPIDETLRSVTQQMTHEDRLIIAMQDLSLPTRSILGIHQEWPIGSEMDRTFARCHGRSLTVTPVTVMITAYGADFGIVGRMIDVLINEFGIHRKLVTELNIVSLVSETATWSFAITKERL